MISYVIPYDTSKDLCKSYNRECERLRGGTDWVVFTDGDALFLDSYFGKHIEEIIEENPKARCFTATCNRIGTPYQMVPAGAACGDDITKHRQVARVMKEQYGNTLVDVTEHQPFSGFFIALRKDLWEQIGGFKYWYPEGHPKRGMLGVDSRLHIEVAKHDKVYMAKGIYLYHYYSGGLDKRNTNHLTK